jgi:glutamine amidotransferase
LDFSGTDYSIFHAREASTRKLTGDRRFQHPFRGDWKEGTIFLAHNGVIEKDRLAAELDPPIDTEWMVDSEVGLTNILQQLTKGHGLEDATRKLQGFTKLNRALNLLLLEIPKKGSPQIFVKQFYNKDVSNPEDRTEYYQINYQKLDSGGIAVFSSTLARVEEDLKGALILEETDLTPLSELS